MHLIKLYIAAVVMLGNNDGSFHSIFFFVNWFRALDVCVNSHISKNCLQQEVWYSDMLWAGQSGD
jgi:hypothetical protein